MKTNMKLAAFLLIIFNIQVVSASNLSLDELYNSAIQLRKTKSYIQAYEMFLEVVKENKLKDFTYVKTLYNLGFTAHKMGMSQEASVWFTKSNLENYRLFQKEYLPAKKSIKLLIKEKFITEDIVSEPTEFKNIKLAKVNASWKGTFCVQNNDLTISHSPNSLKVGFINNMNGGVFTVTGGLFGMKVKGCGLRLHDGLSRNDLIQHFLQAGITIIEKK